MDMFDDLVGYNSSGLQCSSRREDIIIGYDGTFIQLEEDDLCHIDEETAQTLELIQNNIDISNRRHSLFGYLNFYASTTTGMRLIRESIMKPLCHQKTLEHRLRCTEFFITRVDTLHLISNSIKRFGTNIDLDKVVPVLANLYKSRISTLNMAEKKLDAISNVEIILSEVSGLINALEAARDDCFDPFRIVLKNLAYQDIIDDINEVIEPETNSSKGKRWRMFRIKQGVEPLFDIARSTFTAAINDLEQYVRELSDEESLPWKLMYGESRGYFLTIRPDKLPKDFKLGARYLKVTKTRSMISCTTQDLMQSNVRANVSYENSMKLANEVLSSVLCTIMNHMGTLNRLIDVIGMLDMITCFAKLVVSSNGGLVRPEYTSTYTLLEKSRHPVLEYLLQTTDNIKITANDVILKNQSQNVLLVTGPNMGGKSIYLKQVGLTQVMAQIGCFVPAGAAHVKLMNRIVARSGTTDDNQSNCSSFMYEMRGIATALNGDIQDTLFLIDEVGRGTSIEDGSSYSFAIAEELLQRPNSFTIFATHFEQVFYLPNLYTNVIPYHFKCHQEVDENGESRVVISHDLVPGAVEKYHYGIKIAETCDLPTEIIKLAIKDNEL